jgi:hypothetical protein
MKNPKLAALSIIFGKTGNIPVFPKSVQIVYCFLPTLFSPDRYNDYSSSPPAAERTT